MNERNIKVKGGDQSPLNVERQNINLRDEINENLGEAKLICRIMIEDIGNGTHASKDGKQFAYILDDIGKFELELSKQGSMDDLASSYKVVKDYDNWSNDMKELAHYLENAGTTCLKAINTDSRVRKIPKKNLLKYQNCFYYLYQVKGLLNMNDEYPRFGYCASEMKRWGKELMSKL